MKTGDEALSWEREPQPPIPLRGPSRREPVFYEPTPGYTQVDGELEDDAGVNIMRWIHILLKWKWIVIASVAIALILGLTATLLTTPRYRTSAVVKIERETVKVLNSEGVQPRETGGDEFYQTQFQLLRSRHMAEATVANFHLADNAAFLNQGVGRGLFKHKAVDVSKMTRDQRVEMAIGLVMGGLTVEPVRPSRMVKITYTSADPAMAAIVANDIAETFLQDNLSRRFDSNAYARKFLQDRLEQVRQKLEESERALIAYQKAQQIIEVPGARGMQAAGAGQAIAAPPTSLTATNLDAANGALAAATNERMLAEQRYRQLQGPNGAAIIDADSASIQTMRQRRAEAQADYNSQLDKPYRADHPKMVALKQKIDDYDKAIQAERDLVKAGLQSRYEIAQKQEQALQAKVEQGKSAYLDLQSRSVQYNILQRDAQQNRNLYENLLEQSKTVNIAGAIDANNISIIDRAQPNYMPFKPRPAMNLLFSAALGLLIGAALAIGIEQLDDSIKSPEDVDTKLGVPLLGAIPIVAKGLSPAEALADPRSAFSEAYYSVRTALQFSTSEGVPSNLLVTSSRPSEGKSTTAMALAQNFARLGLRTLLIDSDLRNPSLHKVLGRHNSTGFSNILTGSSTLQEASQQTDDPNLTFLACGPLPPNPAELLAGPKARAILKELSEEFDQVIIDGPPVMGLADAPLLASFAAGTIMVIAAGSTRRGLARASIKRLHLSHARLLGAVLTKFNARRSGYGYGYGYGSAYAYAYDYGGGPETQEEPKQIGAGSWFSRRRNDR